MNMTLQEAIVARHSVRKYIKKPLSEEIVAVLNEKIEECNRIGGLHVQLVTNEPKAFSGIFAYGKFSGVENYIVMLGAKSDDLDKRIGYYGEQLVLLAQTLGLNTCWAGLSYRKVKGTYQIADGEKLACMIAIGYGESQGVKRKSKTLSQVSNIDERTPEWFSDGVKAALLAPTAINQQKFYFRYISADNVAKPQVMATTVFSMVGYTDMDLGIAKLHFELGAGKENFEWM